MRYLLAVLALSLPTIAHSQVSHLSFEEKLPGDILDSSVYGIESAEKKQKQWASALNTVGRRCIGKWSDLSPSYAEFNNRFVKLTKEAITGLKKVKSDLNGVHYSGMDSRAAGEVSRANICGGNAAAVEAKLAAAKKEVKEGITHLNEIGERISKLQAEGLEVFETKAVKNYRRHPFCLFEHYYTDVARITFGNSPLVNDREDSGFSETRYRLNRAIERLEIEADEIERQTARFKRIKECKPGAKEEEPEQPSYGNEAT